MCKIDMISRRVHISNCVNKTLVFFLFFLFFKKVKTFGEGWWDGGFFPFFYQCPNLSRIVFRDSFYSLLDRQTGVTDEYFNWCSFFLPET